MNDRAAHWEEVYATKDVEAVSWYQDEPKLSLDLIQAAPGPDLPDGSTVWGFILGRDRGSEPWRIDGAGRGGAPAATERASSS